MKSESLAEHLSVNAGPNVHEDPTHAITASVLAGKKIMYEISV